MERIKRLQKVKTCRRLSLENLVGNRPNMLPSIINDPAADGRARAKHKREGAAAKNAAVSGRRRPFACATYRINMEPLE